MYKRQVRTGVARGIAQMLFILIPFALYLIVFSEPLNMVYCAVSYTHLDVYKRQPLGRIGEPEDVANAFVYLASDMSSYEIGRAHV